MTANSDGGKEAELRYRAFGEMRYTDGDTPTERRFTGQIEDGTIGLYFYNARYYDASLGRFVQADTIVPNPADPQSLNRYSYVLNNPLKFIDPSGHFTEDEIEQYLRSEYGDLWSLYWQAWHFDQVFWDMLIMATYDDVLFAPTTDFLGSGLFSRGKDSFGFESSHGLEEYQGYGPYRLLDKKGNDKLSVEKEFSGHIYDFDTRRYQEWEQPLYHYTENGPSYSGYDRRVSYRRGSISVNLFSGDNVPILCPFAENFYEIVNFLPPYMGALCKICPYTVVAS